MRRLLERAIDHHQLINMVYQSKEGQITQRRIKVLMVKNGQLHAFCFLRQAKRTFNMDNILALEPVQTKRNMVI